MSKAKTTKPNNSKLLELPIPQNGRIFGQILSIEEKTHSGIILANTTNESASKLKVLAVADKLERIKLSAGDVVMVHSDYLKNQTIIGSTKIIIVHEMDVLGIWKH